MTGGSSLPGVSRETRERLDIYVAELTRWQKALNLVSLASLGQVWTRHVDDCLQLVAHAPTPASWVDLGSGAGLPGLIVAAARPAEPVTLVESDSRKCAFLRSTARLMGLDVAVREGRAERSLAGGGIDATIVTARGLATLATLLAYAQPILARGAEALFLKGRGAERELTEARESWNFEADLLASRTDPEGRIVHVQRFSGPRRVELT